MHKFRTVSYKNTLIDLDNAIQDFIHEEAIELDNKFEHYQHQTAEELGIHKQVFVKRDLGRLEHLKAKYKDRLQ